MRSWIASGALFVALAGCASPGQGPVVNTNPVDEATHCRCEPPNCDPGQLVSCLPEALTRQVRAERETRAAARIDAQAPVPSAPVCTRSVTDSGGPRVLPADPWDCPEPSQPRTELDPQGAGESDGNQETDR